MKAEIHLRNGDILETDDFGGMKLILDNNIYGIYDDTDDKKYICFIDKNEFLCLIFIRN